MNSLEVIAAEMTALGALLDARGVSAELGEVNWTYDEQGRHIEAVSCADVIIMGFNAGGGGTGSEARWRTRCAQLARGFDNGFMLAELILIASHNVGALRAVHGNLSELIRLCVGVNKAIISHHRPKVIVHTGFDEIEAVKESYGLTEKADRVRRTSHESHTLLRHFEMPDGTPWLSIKHPSSWGFSRADIAAIHTYAQQIAR